MAIALNSHDIMRLMHEMVTTDPQIKFVTNATAGEEGSQDMEIDTDIPEQVVAHRTGEGERKDKREYRFRWKGYPPKDDNWELSTNDGGCPENQRYIDEYETRLKEGTQPKITDLMRVTKFKKMGRSEHYLVEWVGVDHEPYWDVADDKKRAPKLGFIATSGTRGGIPQEVIQDAIDKGRIEVPNLQPTAKKRRTM